MGEERHLGSETNNPHLEVKQDAPERVECAFPMPGHHVLDARVKEEATVRLWTVRVSSRHANRQAGKQAGRQTRRQA